MAVLGFVKRARALGFTLAEIEELLELAEGGPEACDRPRDDRVLPIATGTRSPHLPGRAGAAMRLQVLHVPGCPNAAVLTDRLVRLVGDRGSVEQQVVQDADEAAMLGMNGSPTLLIDGVDPFDHPGLRPSLSCRLYPDEKGSLAGAPTVAQLRKIIGVQGWRSGR